MFNPLHNPDLMLGFGLGVLLICLVIAAAFVWMVVAARLDPEAPAREAAEKAAFEVEVRRLRDDILRHGLPPDRRVEAFRKAKAQAQNWPRHGDRAVDVLRYDLASEER